MRYITVLTKNTYLLLAVLLLAFLGCERYEFENTHVELNFSADTVSFDTVFMPIGSTTFSCKVYNRSNKQLIIDEIRLALGYNSPFTMNVDGLTGSSIRGIRLAKKDSLFIFLEVKKNEAMLLTDQIVFVTGGTEQQSRIELMAYGQAVVVMDKDTALQSDYTFTSEKPYLVMGNVTIDSGVTVNVEGGAKLYFGKGCGITVNGTLNVNGLLSSPCIFSHPRYKDAWYNTASGQWQGITVNATGKARITFAQLRGARQAFYVLDTLYEAYNYYNSHPQLRLSRSKIEYSEIGINICDGSVVADNCLVSHSRTNALLLQGGIFQAYHCTFVAYDMMSSEYHGTQVVLQNFRVRGKRDTIDTPLHLAVFSNSIIYGSNENEVTIRQRPYEEMDPPQFGFSAIRMASLPDNAISVITDNPKFEDVGKNNFHLSEGSPAINAGRADVAHYPSLRMDLDGYNRTDLYNGYNGVVAQDSSMGCYAYRVKE